MIYNVQLFTMSSLELVFDLGLIKNNSENDEEIK